MRCAGLLSIVKFACFRLKYLAKCGGSSGGHAYDEHQAVLPTWQPASND